MGRYSSIALLVSVLIVGAGVWQSTAEAAHVPADPRMAILSAMKTTEEAGTVAVQSVVQWRHPGCSWSSTTAVGSMDFRARSSQLKVSSATAPDVFCKSTVGTERRQFGSAVYILDPQNSGKP